MKNSTIEINIVFSWIIIVLSGLMIIGHAFYHYEEDKKELEPKKETCFEIERAVLHGDQLINFKVPAFFCGNQKDAQILMTGEDGSRLYLDINTY